MKKIFLLIALSPFLFRAMFAQVSINADNSAPDSSAMLDVKSTNRGVLLPRMTQAQIAAIQGPANGLMVFCTTDSKLYIYLSSLLLWKEVPCGAGAINPPFTCGNPVFINHIAGVVAPVSKMVTYGTVNNIPGESSKCWITRNLGADRQAVAVNDATEVSAGWYWQFNRKQGYKHDGLNRTPDTPWMGVIIESSDWLAVYDPCSIEMGSQWRIPTYSEWYNVDNSGGWTTWSGPWNSGLKIHAAGYLNDNNGSLDYRGTIGACWSSLQYNSAQSWSLNFQNNVSSVSNNSKPYGFPLRCLREN
jgi:hypothetical protein